MTESVETFSIGQYDVQICMVSGEAAPNLLPIACYRPKKVVMLVSPQMQNQADQLKASISEVVPATKTERVSLAAPNDTNRTTQVILDCIRREEAAKVVVNATGGTKLMSIAAFRAAAAAGVPVFYVNYQDNSVTLFPAGDLSRGTVIPSVQAKIEMKHYLAAYGYASEDYSDPAEVLGDAETDLIREIITGNKAMNRAVAALNDLAVRAEKTNLRTIGLARTRTDPRWRPYPDNLKEFNRLVRNFSDAGYLTEQDGELEFPDEEARFFVAGGWLEYYVGICLQEKGLKPWVNLKVKKQARNEIDAAFFHDNKFYVVECKTSWMSDPAKVRQIAYKLESLRKIGGLNTQLILISYQPLFGDSLKVAEQSGIHVICGPKLAQLKEEMGRVIHVR